MLGIRYMKAPPTTYVLHYQGGKVVREGAGLAFFYYGPFSVIVSVPLATTSAPFVFHEITADFQEATIQGELTFRILDAKRTAALLDFSLDPFGRYRSEDPGKLSERLVSASQILARGFTQGRKLREVLKSSDALAPEVLAGLRQSETAQRLGVEIVDLTILSIKASPEMTKALEAEAREELLKQADEAIYARRNTAVLLERTIKENELNTQIAVEQKQRQVRETKMAADVAVEEQRATLVERKAANDRQEADARAHALQAVLGPLKELDWRTLLAANASNSGDGHLGISLAFQELAQNASKIGELNITPEVLAALARRQE